MGGFPMGGGFGGGFPMGGFGGGFPMGGFPMGGYGAPGAGPATGGTGSAATSSDMTGGYLGQMSAMMAKIPKVVPNPYDNTLLIQATQQEYEQVAKLLDKLDVPPRQVLIEAKIYEISLTGAFASGVQAFLQRQGTPRTGAAAALTRQLTGTMGGGGIALSAGLLVGRSRELLSFLIAQEDTRRSKVISSPSVIATDNIPATITVGSEVPTLASQAVTGIQQGGSSLFANTIQQRQAGTTLNISARVLPSGIVTLVINQEVSSPIAPSANAAIQSPSFSKRSVNTQVTVQDGDLIAIGGIIQESDTLSQSGVPGLSRLPVVGGLFGNRSTSKERTEMVIFMTPRVIYDTTEVADASEELRGKLRRLSKIIKD